jgi:TATA-box binding protein (TBP) (component of TFIID and TFIIIB)
MMSLFMLRRENGMVTMKLRHPYTTASIWSSGKITCTGANTEQEAKTAARKFSRILQKLGKKNSLGKQCLWIRIRSLLVLVVGPE